MYCKMISFYIHCPKTSFCLSLPLALFFLMGGIMKQILFRLTDDEYERAKKISLLKGFNNINTFSKFSVLNCDAELSNVVVENNPSKQVSVSLYPYEIEMLERNAKLHGMSLSREMAIRLRQSCLKNEACLYPEEVNELRKLVTAIDKVGRNIHFIIKGERFCTVNDPEFRNDVVEVIQLFKTATKKIDSLMNSAVNRFG